MGHFLGMHAPPGLSEGLPWSNPAPRLPFQEIIPIVVIYSRSQQTGRPELASNDDEVCRVAICVVTLICPLFRFSALGRESSFLPRISTKRYQHAGQGHFG
jgi:hypothetical protein